MGSYFLAHLYALGGGILIYTIPFLFVLSLVVFFHELGHFLVARWCGVRVLVFSIGFGPEIIGFNDRYGTRWKISLIPLGGFVKFFGDENAASVPDGTQLAGMNAEERAQSFVFQPIYKRAAIVAAGPIANFLLAIAIFAATIMIYGSPVDSPEAMSARVEGVDPGSAAAAAGFEPGDLVVAIDGEPIANFAEMQRIVSENPQRKLDITVQRRGAEVVLSAVPKSDKDILGNRIGRLGIHGPLPAKFAYQPVSPPQAVWMGMQETWFVVDQTFKYIGGVITGHRAADQLSGPIGIARVIGKAANISFGFVIHIAAVISVSIGLLNLFPIPLLDGGHLLFYLIEGIRGRPLSERAQELGFRIGLAIVLMLMIFATFNDIVHLTTS